MNIDQMFEKVRQLETELAAWKLAAAQTGLYPSDTDISTPDKWKEAQAKAACALLSDKERIDWLEANSGHFQDDSATVIRLSPDDATREWIFRMGKFFGYGGSIRSAIDKARNPFEGPHRDR